MNHPPLQPGWIDRPHESASLGDLLLASGEVLKDCMVSFVRHGRGERFLLCLTAIGSTHHRLDPWIGPGRALDTDRYCVLCVDALGNGLSSSPSNSRTQPGLAFPRFTIRDMVESQHRLLQHLGIESVAAVVGASMGGMQALQWAVSHPSIIGKVVALTAPACTTPWTVAINEAGRCALMHPADWADENSTAGWDCWAALMQVIAPRTPAAVRGDVRAEIAARARACRSTGIRAIDWVYQSWAYDAHDLGGTPGCRDRRDALARLRAPALLMAPPLDLYNPSEAVRAVADGMANARFVEIPSIEGHAAAAAISEADTAFIDAEVARFLGG
ncbi:MAG: alpha/beta fold hydrolase [Steroidobacteraceae bacterium]